MVTLRRTRIPRLLLGAAILTAAMAGCSHNAADDESGAAASARAEVTLTRVARADISRVVTLTGTAGALLNQDVRVSALVAGRIVDLKVAEGDRVAIGELLAKLDDLPYRDQLQQAEAAAQQAKASWENAQLAFQRNEDLFNRGIAARKDMEDARTEQSVAAAALRQAEAALELAHLQVARTRILSPLNGEVVKRFVSVGEQVDGTGTQPIVEVANLRDVEFLGNAPAMYLAKMHPGDLVEVTSQSMPGENFPGRVVAISPAVDPVTGLGLVRIRVPNPGGVLRMGVYLSADIPIETHAHALVVPPEAIYRNEAGEPRVFIVNGDTAMAVPVKLGIETKDRIELLSGVKEADTVILRGGYGLGDQAKIQVQSRSESPSEQ
ncbi:MAG: efflux RND transporter periplasmic adaptor subunit [Candidatus Acidiferrales bacterium]